VEASTEEALYVQPSVGARYDLGGGVLARLNLGRYVRAPDLGELFGDRGYAMGNPALEPEVSWNADAGLTWQRENLGALDVGRLEGAAFVSQVDHLIAYVQNSQNTVRPENVARAEIAGFELAGRAALAGHVSFEANYTFTSALNRSPAPYLEGKRLPGRPAHALYAKAELCDRIGGFAARLAADVDYSAVTYLDQANLEDAGVGRPLVGVALGLERVPLRLSLTLEIENLLDAKTVEDRAGRSRPISDFDGFPLPGRAFLATLRWRS
jgi:iron complex outermembrane receptor protein